MLRCGGGGDVGDGERDGGEVCAGGVSAKEPPQVGLALEDFGERGVEGLANKLDAGDVVGKDRGGECARP